MNIPIKNCSSCGACANICHHSAISMKLDSEGFYRPVIDEGKCVQCGICETTCPWNRTVENPNEASVAPQTIAAYAKDDPIRMQSSSGGIFTVLAEQILDKGGTVIGVAQLGKTHFGHIVVDNKSDLEKLRSSKYVQADTGFIYREVLSILKKGQKVLFSGTPCQVAALYAVLGSKASTRNLYTVDIVCHGVPSVKVFEKYINEIEQSNKDSLKKIIFRDKQENGWKDYSIRHEFNSGNHSSIPSTSSAYMKLMLSRICQNASCEKCLYRKLPRIADITLGDYWGIEKFHPQMDDNKGTSAVLLNTFHGEELFYSISSKIVQCDSSIEKATLENPCISKSTKQHAKRAEFFTNLDRYTLNYLIKTLHIHPLKANNLWNFLHLPDTRIRERLIRFFSSLNPKAKK